MQMCVCVYVCGERFVCVCKYVFYFLEVLICIAIDTLYKMYFSAHTQCVPVNMYVSCVHTHACAHTHTQRYANTHPGKQS